MSNSLARLLMIGFTLAGEWRLDGERAAPHLLQHASVKNALYAFVVDGQVDYVGKTVQTLAGRMAGYRNPGARQSTNIKNQQNAQRCLEDGSKVDIYVLPDNGLLAYGGFHLNLAAGLEDAIVRELSPNWNGGQKETPEQELEPLTPPPTPAAQNDVAGASGALPHQRNLREIEEPRNQAPIWSRVQHLEGQTLLTLQRERPFKIVQVTDDRVVFAPESGKTRWFPRADLEFLASLNLPRDLIRARILEEWPNDQNSSYISAIVYEVTRFA